MLTMQFVDPARFPRSRFLFTGTRHSLKHKSRTMKFGIASTYGSTTSYQFLFSFVIVHNSSQGGGGAVGLRGEYEEELDRTDKEKASEARDCNFCG